MQQEPEQKYKVINGQVAIMKFDDSPVVVAEGKTEKRGWVVDRFLKKRELPLNNTHVRTTDLVKPQEYRIS